MFQMCRLAIELLILKVRVPSRMMRWLLYSLLHVLLLLLCALLLFCRALYFHRILAFMSFLLIPLLQLEFALFLLLFLFLLHLGLDECQVLLLDLLWQSLHNPRV